MASGPVRERPALVVDAPAKINLALHVTGRRPDGYHELDSLVVFAGRGDRLSVRPAPAPSFQVTGPFGAFLSDGGDNLVRRAAALFDPPVSAAITLEKHLPVASGIGGGSADAAAALRALAQLSARDLPSDNAILGLGADVPVCLRGRPTRMRGIGEQLGSLPPLPPLWLVLANPAVAVPTGPVFARLSAFGDPLAPFAPWPTAERLARWLADQRNDLQAPAIAEAPVIGSVLSALDAQAGCLLARMSGSGATCFGLFADASDASAAAGRLGAEKPDWWVRAAPVLA